ncbi:MAG: hypothetical protein ACK4F5_17370 [Aliihoeflea sp.]
MADYFTHFSCLLDVGTPDKAARALALFQELRAADHDADDPEVTGFDLVRQDAPEGSTLWIHDDDHGDVEAVIRFWSQGDGACFEGYWSHAKRAAVRIRDYAPTDAPLHGIADRLQAIQRRNFYQLAAEVSHRGRYYHEYTMSIDVTRDSPTWQPPTEDAEETVTEALRDLARWLYRQLQAEYDHLTSVEAIEEGIIVNEYTFTEAGRRFG